MLAHALFQVVTGVDDEGVAPTCPTVAATWRPETGVFSGGPTHGGHMSADDDELPDIPVVCSECDTRTKVPFPEVENTVTRHNERLHDGEAVAEVDPAVMDRLADFVAEDLGLLE